MQRRNLLRVFALLAGTALVPLAAEASDPVKIGAILPLSGSSSLAGTEVINGVTLAVEDFNASGGAFDGRMFELIKEDDESVPTKGVTAAKKLIERDKVVGLVGTYNSAVALPVAEVARAAKIPIVSGGSTSIGVTDANTAGDPWFFRPFPGSTAQATQSAEDTIKTLGKKKIAILYENTPYGKALTESFEKLTTPLGAEIVSKELYNQGDQDFFTQLSKLRGLRPDGIYLAGLIGEGAAIVRQAPEVGLKTQFIGSGGMMSDKFIELAGPAAEGFAVSTMYEPNTPNETGRAFGERFKKRFGVSANTHAALGYDGAQVLLNGIRKAGSTDGLKIRDAIVAAIDLKLVQGPSGTTAKWDEKGGVSFPLGMAVVKNGVRELTNYK
jgi:branched-chain amino acid transport system substrate-binding protein